MVQRENLASMIVDSYCPNLFMLTILGPSHQLPTLSFYLLINQTLIYLYLWLAWAHLYYRTLPSFSSSLTPSHVFVTIVTGHTCSLVPKLHVIWTGLIIIRLSIHIHFLHFILNQSIHTWTDSCFTHQPYPSLPLLSIFCVLPICVICKL